MEYIIKILRFYFVKYGWFGVGKDWQYLNLCGTGIKIKNYVNLDISAEADIVVDLEKQLLPFSDSTMKTVVCISAINYFSKSRGQEIINDVYRVLKPDGIVRFATQDLEVISEKYVNKDKNFFFQKLNNGRERFEGETIADKFNSWFYGYLINASKHCRYFYDFETLALMFNKAGFKNIKKRKYHESLIPEINLIDNRPDQMFYLEAIK